MPASFQHTSSSTATHAASVPADEKAPRNNHYAEDRPLQQRPPSRLFLKALNQGKGLIERVMHYAAFPPLLLEEVLISAVPIPFWYSRLRNKVFRGTGLPRK